MDGDGIPEAQSQPFVDRDENGCYWHGCEKDDPAEVPIEGEVTVGAVVTGDTSNAENLFGNPSKDKYFLFKPPADDAYTFSTCGSKFDTYLRIFTTDGSGPHSVSTETQIEEHDDTGEFMCTYDDCSTDCCLTVITVDMQEGQDYVVMLEGYDNENGEYRLQTSATDGACALSYSYSYNDWSCFEDDCDWSCFKKDDCDQERTCMSDVSCFDDCGDGVTTAICNNCYNGWESNSFSYDYNQTYADKFSDLCNELPGTECKAIVDGGDCRPTPSPTPKPTSNPTNKPTTKPTIKPTGEDVVPVVKMTVEIITEEVPTSGQVDALKGVFVDELDVDASKIEDFKVEVYNENNELVETITARRRRRLLDDHDHDHGSYTWKVTFTIVEATEEDMAEFATTIWSADFDAEVEEALGVDVKVQEVEGVAAYEEHHDHDTKKKNDNDDEGVVPGVNAAGGYIIVVAAGIAFAIAVAGAFIMCKKAPEDKFQDGLQDEEGLELGKRPSQQARGTSLDAGGQTRDF
jgi:hypothetical protein